LIEIFLYCEGILKAQRVY